MNSLRCRHFLARALNTAVSVVLFACLSARAEARTCLDTPPEEPVNERNYAPTLAARGIMALGEFTSIGPTLGGALVFAESGPANGMLSGGFSLSLFGLPFEKSGNGVADAGLEGGYQFGRDYAFIRGFMAAGWRFVALGISLVGTFNDDHSGFALGPELSFHFRLPRYRWPALQGFARGDFFVASDHFRHQAVIGLRVLFDLIPKSKTRSCKDNR